jgi:hypothetical protein
MLIAKVEVLGIPYEEVMQAALIPMAYTLGPDFKPAAQVVGVDIALGPVVSERVTHVPLASFAGPRALL